VLVELEAHDVGVEVDPLVHLVPADVAHHVVDVLEAGGPRHGRRGDGAKAGQKRAA
jgi:hypothetical protein